MKKVIKFAAIMAATVFAFGFTACSSDPETETSQKSDPLATSVPLEGSYAVVGSNFDEVTASILSSVSGTRCSVSLTDETLPAGVKTVFIDWDSLKTIGNDAYGTLSFPVQNLDRLYNWTKQGATLVFHKPESWSAYTILLHIQDRLAEIESRVGSDTVQTSTSNQISARTATEELELGEFEYDLVAIKPDASTYYLEDVYKPGTENTVSVQTTESIDDDDAKTTETTVTYTATEPTAEQKALYAAEAIKWLNETKSESQARFASVARAAGIDAELMNQVCSETRTIVCKPYQYHISRYFNPEAPLTLRVWTTAMYNFEKDEDYYHVLLEEEFDASRIYKGLVIDGDSGIPFSAYKYAAYTWKNMDLQASLTPIKNTTLQKLFEFLMGKYVYENAYEVTSQWNVQPNGNAAPVTTESIEGWSVGTEVSGTVKGISGKLTGNYTSEKHVKTVENDVSVVNHQTENTMRWEYTFGQQLHFDGKMGKITFTEPARDASCRSNRCFTQSWNWIVKAVDPEFSLKNHDTPFYFEIKLDHMQAQMAYARQEIFQTVKWQEISDMISDYSAQIPLPVPERYKHVYSLTTDEIANLYEYNNLMTALKNVSSNFDQLHAKLIRKDSEGNLCGRTGVTEDAVNNMVGQEWYALAHEIEGKKITVSKPYKFYVKDENDNKLKMVKYHTENGRYESVGTYLVIDTNGIKITNE